MRYIVIYEQGPTSWGAYVPDLPGVVSVGDSREEVVRLIQEAIELHLEGMREDGLPIPHRPVSRVRSKFIRQRSVARLYASQTFASREHVLFYELKQND